MNRNLIHEFLIECMLPGFRNALNHKDEDALITSIIECADRDTMSGGRFNDVYSEHHNEYRASLKELIKLNKDSLNSRMLICTMYQNIHNGVTVGLIQKLVNMSLKYLYAVDAFGYATELGLSVDIKCCDCPLDSIVLEHLKYKTGKDYVPWTKIGSFDVYEEVQKDIRDFVAESNLEFDFKYWGLLKGDEPMILS